MSFEQYLLLVSNSERRYEYYDGEVRLMVGGSSNHATIALNFGVALDQALGDNASCRPYVTDKLVRVAPTKTVIPDVVVSCDSADHGEWQSFHLASLDIEIGVRQLYRRLSIPAVVEQVEEEGEDVPEEEQ